MESNGLLNNINFNLGPLTITSSIISSWFVILILIGLAWFLTRKLLVTPKDYQVVIESIYTAMEDAIRAVLPQHVDLVFPFIATLWIFILISNLLGVIPGFSSPTSDLSVTASLAILTFISVHWFGVRAEGLKNYLRHYLKPSPILLPFHLISEFSRTLALAVRLFGNIMSLEMAALLALMIAGFLLPVPILMLHIIEAIIQAYIFGMLALIYIASGIQAQELRKEKGESYE